MIRIILASIVFFTFTITGAYALNKMVDGVVIEMTAEEVKALNDERAKFKPVIKFLVGYKQWQDRFTEDELNKVSAHVYKIDLETGLPVNGALIQALQRAVAGNQVDLLADATKAFLKNLVDGEIITASRRDEILTPEKLTP